MANKFISKQMLNYIMKNGHNSRGVFKYLVADDFAKFLYTDEHLHLMKELDGDTLIEFISNFTNHKYKELETKFEIEEFIYYLSDESNNTLVELVKRCPEVFYSNMYYFTDSYRHIIPLMDYDSVLSILTNTRTNISSFLEYVNEDVMERLILENRELLGDYSITLHYLKYVKDIEEQKRILKELPIRYVNDELISLIKHINEEQYTVELVNRMNVDAKSKRNLLIECNDIVKLHSYDFIKDILHKSSHPYKYFFSYGYNLDSYDYYHKFLKEFSDVYDCYDHIITRFDKEDIKMIIHKYNDIEFIEAAYNTGSLDLDGPTLMFLVDHHPNFVINNIIGTKTRGELDPAFSDEMIFKLLHHNSSFALNLFKDQGLTPELIAKISDVNPKFLYDLFMQNKDPKYFKDSLYKLGFDNLELYNIKDNPDNMEILYTFLKEGDIPEDKFVILFKKLIISEDDRLIRYSIERAAKYNNQSLDDFMEKFIKLKSTNANLLDSLDYRLFNQRYSFLTDKQVEVLSVHGNVFDSLAKSSDKELEVISTILKTYDNLNWINLLDRILSFKDNYKSLIDNIDVNSLNEDRINKLIFLLTRDIKLDIKDINNLDLVDDKLKELIESESIRYNADSIRNAIFIKFIGLSDKEVRRLNDVYCNDLENIEGSKEFSDDLKEVLKFINKVYSTNDIDVLKEIFNNIKEVKLANDFAIDLETEIKRSFARDYNTSLYHPMESDYVDRLTYEGANIPVYSCSGLDGGSDFGLMISSLSAYTDGQRPEDFYADWNKDLITSHGFCCSYLQNDNLGTAVIKYAVLGFSDFADDALLLAGPYDLVSKFSNVEFNVTKEQKNNKFYLPRGMVDNTRHTHNEMVFERRDLSEGAKQFKKAPSYVVFFCDDYSKLTEDERRILDLTKQCAYQMGMGSNGSPLPIVLVDRKKIAAKQAGVISELLEKACSDSYQEGDILRLVTKLKNNVSGNREYHNNINDEFFLGSHEDVMFEAITNRVFDLLSQNRFEEIKLIHDDLINTISIETKKSSHSKKSFDSYRYENVVNLCNSALLLRDVEDVKYLKDLLSSIGSLSAKPEGYDSRFSKTNIQSDNMMRADEIMPLLVSHKDSLNLFIKKVKELESLDIYEKDTRYDNRNIVNKMFYAMIYNIKNRSGYGLEELLDLVMYERCSYMDGEDKQNVDSSIKKMIRLKEENPKVAVQRAVDMLLINDGSLTRDQIDKKLEELGFNNRFLIYSAYGDRPDEFRRILNDVNALEYTRYVKGVEFSEGKVQDPSMRSMIKIAFELQEAYASRDIKEYVSIHPEYQKSVDKALETLSPQEVIRLIRKGRFELREEEKKVDFDKALKYADNEETMDPLGIIDSKMDAYGKLPPQVSLEDMIGVVNESGLYDQLVESIKTGDNLYLDKSQIHGVTHAGNVSLIALYLATKNGLSDVDVKTLLEASVYHDIGRTADSGDYGHGINGASKYLEQVAEKEGLDKGEVALLIEAHALPGNTNGEEFSSQMSSLLVRYNIDPDRRDNIVKLATLIRDADALDRTRFRLTDGNSNNLRVEYLFDPNSLEIIKAIQQLNNIIYSDYINSITEERVEGVKHGKE